MVKLNQKMYTWIAIRIFFLRMYYDKTIMIKR